MASLHFDLYSQILIGCKNKNFYTRKKLDQKCSNDLSYRQKPKYDFQVNNRFELKIVSFIKRP